MGHGARQAQLMAARNPKYDTTHDTERAAWVPVVATGRVECRRGPRGCRAPSLMIDPDEEWELGHPDAACDAPTAPEHLRCNRATMTHRRRVPELHPAVYDLLQHPGGDPLPHP